ncbi:AAA family ATPase [Catenulispora yoronensis]
MSPAIHPTDPEAPGLAPTPGEVFVGRAAESERLLAGAGEARAGRAWLAVIEGEAGIGKSALARRLTSSLPDFTVLWATGDVSETELPGGVVGQLTRRVDRALADRFPLLGPDAATGASPHAVGGQLLLLLGALQESTGPVALVVDDFHWADPFSVQVLGFVLRRLWADRVLTVLVTRSEEERTTESLHRLVRSTDRAARIEVGGLAEDDVARLADSLLDTPAAPGLVERLYSYTKGHPLYVRTVLAEVPIQTLGAEAAARWPVPRSLRVGISDLMERLPAESVALLEALAVLDARLPLATVAQVGALPDPARALKPALAAGLAQWWPAEAESTVALVHALQRDAVYEAIGPERRRTLHAAAAGVVGTAASWAHRVAAAGAADAGLAAELEQSGGAEAVLGRNALAATRLLWASALSDRSEDRERRLLTACAQSLLTMQPATAMRLRPQVEDCAPSTLRGCVLGVMDLLEGRFADAEARLSESWQAALADPESGWVAVLAGTFLAVITIRQCRGARTVDIATRTLAIGDLDPATTDFTRAVLATGRMWDKGPRAALEDVAHLPRLAADSANHQLETLATRGVMSLFVGDLPAARADLATVARRDQQGAGSKLSHLSLSLWSVTEYLSGDWNAAESAADRALAIAASQDHVLGDAAAGFAAVCVQAGRGLWDAAEAQLTALTEITRMLGDPPAEAVYLALAGALLAQARADHAAMLVALEPMVDRHAEDGGIDPDAALRLRYQPFRLWQRSLLVEALIGTGQVEAATRSLRELEEEDCDHGGYSRLVEARLNGLLAEAQGRPEEALAAYREVLDGGAGAGSGAAGIRAAREQQARTRRAANPGQAPVRGQRARARRAADPRRAPARRRASGPARVRPRTRSSSARCSNTATAGCSWRPVPRPGGRRRPGSGRRTTGSPRCVPRRSLSGARRTWQRSACPRRHRPAVRCTR